MRIENNMYRQLQRLNRFPAAWRPYLQTFLMGRFVPFIKTARLRCDHISRETVKVSIPNIRPIQNHIHNVHACCMALLAETASGFVFNMNTPDDKLPLCKSMNVQFVKRSVGAMRAEATLSCEEAQRIQTEEKGNMPVRVLVYDESDEPPVEVEIVWAWVPKKPVEDLNEAKH